MNWLARHVVFRFAITLFVKERETGPLVVVVIVVVVVVAVSRVLRTFWSILKQFSGAIRRHRSV